MTGCAPRVESCPAANQTQPGAAYETLAEATYPEMAKYPDETAYMKKDGSFDDEGFSKVYDAWWADRRKQTDQPEGYTAVLDSYLRTVIPQLLTGGAGFIGSHIAVELLQRDYDVVIADDLSNSRPDVPERIEKITGRAPVFYRMDVSDRQALDRVFRAHDIAAAVHLAGYKAVGESVQKPLAYYRNNLDTTLALLEVMADHGVHRLIFSSSATVYGNAEAPCREDMPTGGCTNPYAWTKLMIEQILRDAAKADPSLAAVCLRYFNPVGAHESGLIGELPNGIPNNLMPYITQTAAGIRRELTVFGNDYPTPDGTGVRDYIHVVDLARGHAAALDYSRTHPGWEAINLGTGRGSSVLEIVETFQRVNGVAVPHRIGPRRPGDLPTCYAATDKAARLLHWHAEKDLADMCRDSWRWQQSQQ